MAGSQTDAATVFFFFFHMFGWIGSLVVFLTVVLSPKVQRHMVWTNLCLTWIISGLSYSFLLLTGQAGTSEPNESVCLLQASAIYAVPSLTSGATLSLAIHIWIQYRNSNSTSRSVERLKDNVVSTVVLVAVPYLLPVAFFVTMLVCALERPSDVLLVQESKMYCKLDHSWPGLISTIFAMSFLIPTLIIEILVLFNLRSRWSEYRFLSPNVINTAMRLVVFTLFPVCALVAGIVFLSGKGSGHVANAFTGLPALSFVIIFGSQKDIIRAWMFWRSSGVGHSSLEDFQRPHKPVEIRVELSRFENVEAA